MFNSSVYIKRRDELKKLVKNGLIVFPGNNEVPINYPSNTYPFRQDSSFLYYFGIDKPGLVGIIDVDNEQEIIFGDDREIDDIIWMGNETPLSELAASVGVKKVLPFSDFQKYIENFQSKNENLHFLPQYQINSILTLSEILNVSPKNLNKHASVDLIKSVISQRIIKSEEEVAEIEKAINISNEMYHIAMRFTKPEMSEQEIYGLLQAVALSASPLLSFQPIFSVRGEVLHNHSYQNIMKDGQLAVLDSGVESELHYASDITRTFPLNGKFSDMQANIYNVVLNAQLKAIENMKPEISYRDIHLLAAKEITLGLQNLGLMKGNVDDSLNVGAHALFFPHGLGHMLGLDVHDMEGLGENHIGYDDEFSRSSQFGLAYLRFAKRLKPGHVITVEPGIYFIPPLINNWKKENKHSDFINYQEVEKYLDFGGIRIEDDVLITGSGSKVLGPGIPKTIEEIENICNS